MAETKNSKTAAPAGVSKEQIDLVARNLEAACTLIMTINKFSMEQTMSGDDGGHLGESIRALSEKAGYICDSAVRSLTGGGGVYGNFDSWAGLEFAPGSEVRHG